MARTDQVIRVPVEVEVHVSLAPIRTGRTRDVLDDVFRERLRHLWLGFTEAHDDAHGAAGLLRIIDRLTAKATTGPTADLRDDLVSIAAVAVAAVETYDRANRPPRA